MLVPRQEYSRELKVACMRELDSGKGVAEVARQYPNGWRYGRANGVPKVSWRFPAKGRVRRPDWIASTSPYSSARSGSRPWRSIS